MSRGGSLTGEPLRVADEVSYDALTAEAAFDVSNNGRLIYFAGEGPAVDRQFVWHDRTGRQLGNEATPASTPRISILPGTERRSPSRQRNRQGSQYDIWLIDWARNFSRRLTFDPALSPNGNVVWSPDGRRVAFASQRAGNRDIYEKNVNGVGIRNTPSGNPGRRMAGRLVRGRTLSGLRAQYDTSNGGTCSRFHCSAIESPSPLRIRRSARTNPASRKTVDGWPTTRTNQG